MASTTTSSTADKHIILITGANTGLGYETIKALAQSSTTYDIILGSRSAAKGEDAMQRLKAEVPDTSSSVTVLEIDITSDESINRAFEDVRSKWGRLDTLVNNAGGSFDTELLAGTMTLRESFNRSYDLNVSSVQVLTQVFMPLLLESRTSNTATTTTTTTTTRTPARLLFITSGTSSLNETLNAAMPINSAVPAGWPKPTPDWYILGYRASKTGLNMVFRDWVRVLGRDAVKVFAISPGFLATGLAGVGADRLRERGARDPSIGGAFVREVVEGRRDDDAGLVIRKDVVQPW
ncbi:Dihydroanticapsin 7-dehydrogenase 1 [Phlyctema vagabunda]|uniref:Dihydroanticapsin 7-dehydrogenase 1 n=1 Tax=Phlyctema vagabunda TaxID=108571 RepID=A0ABR4P8M7_9HELO